MVFFSYRRSLFLLLVLKALLIISVIFYAGIGLGPDEAQYWTWSRSLDWGYYSKPPGIAWLIWLGTQLFGQTEWGVRSLSLFIAILQSLAIYQLAIGAGLLQRSAFWCALFMAFTPLGILGSFFAITDVGFLLCWTGAALMVVPLLNRHQAPDPIKVGLWILAGALFKWPIYLFWVFYLFARHWFFQDQKISTVIKGISISLLGLLPSVWWNLTHDWATFRHVFATIQGGSGHRSGGNFFEFIGSQAVLISPILFFLLLFSFWHWFRQRKQISPSLFFCGFVAFASLAIIAFVSLFQKVQGNWISFAYPTAFIVLGWDLFEQNSRRVLCAKIGLGLSILLTGSNQN